MKSLMSVMIFALCTQSYAFDIKDAVDVALFEADIEVGKDNILAYKAELNGDEVEVAIKTSTADILSYGCHRHGPQMACHEEGHDHLMILKDSTTESIFDQMQEGAEAAVNKFEKTLQQRGSNLASVSNYKVWTTEGTDDHKSNDHVDVWVRFDYKLSNQLKTIYVQCHEHGHGTLACHYGQTGHNEPQF